VDVILLAIAPGDTCAEAEAPGGYPSVLTSNRETGRRRRQRRLGTFLPVAARSRGRRFGSHCCLPGLELSTEAFEEIEAFEETERDELTMVRHRRSRRSNS